MQKSALRGSWRELSNSYLLAKFGFDTAENEPPKVFIDVAAMDRCVAGADVAAATSSWMPHLEAAGGCTDAGRYRSDYLSDYSSDYLSDSTSVGL